ncbi:MAG: ferredoxin [Actinomycetes bacterium]
MRISADRDVCIGAGMCVMTAPAVFDQDDDGIVVLVTPDIPAEQAAAAIRATQLCPSGALRLVQD